MKLRHRTILIGLLAAALGSASFLTAMGMGEPVASVQRTQGTGLYQHLGDWLSLSAEQVNAMREDDPTFESEAASLDGALADARERLASLLEDPQAADQAVRDQVQKVVQARAALEIRVANYLLAVRHHLRTDQQKQLMGLCAASVREGVQYRWRGGRGSATDGRAGPGSGSGDAWGGRGRGGPGGSGSGNSGRFGGPGGAGQ
jgi:Spy/CpxP family protein refolding chaperone